MIKKNYKRFFFESEGGLRTPGRGSPLRIQGQSNAKGQEDLGRYTIYSFFGLVWNDLPLGRHSLTGKINIPIDLDFFVVVVKRLKGKKRGEKEKRKNNEFFSCNFYRSPFSN